MRQHRTHNQHGLFMVTGLLILSLMSVGIAAGLTRSLSELSAANGYVHMNQVFQVAEAGFDEAVWELTKSYGDFKPGLPPAAPDGEGWDELDDAFLDTLCEDPLDCVHYVKTVDLTQDIQHPNGVQQFTVEVIDAYDYSPMVRVTGTYGSRTETIVATVTRPQAAFNRLYGQDSVVVGSFSFDAGPVHLDSYDCDLGNCVYNEDLGGGEFNKGAEAVIAANDQPGEDFFVDLYIRNVGTVEGAAHVGRDIDPQDTTEVLIDGVLTNDPDDPTDDNEAVQMTLLPLPPVIVPFDLQATCPPFPPNIFGDHTTVGDSGTPGLITLDTDTCVGNIDVLGDVEIVLEPGVDLYLTGTAQTSLRLRDNTTIIAQGNNKIYGNGGIWSDSYRGFTNVTQRPVDLQIRMEGSTSSQTIRQSDPFYGAVYLRQAGVFWTKGHYCGGQPACGGYNYTPGNFHGAIVTGGNLQFAAHDPPRFDFHQDRSLDDLTISGFGWATFQILSWHVCKNNDADPLCP